MKLSNRILLLVLLVCLLVAAFPVSAQTDATHYQPALTETQMPDQDRATGTLIFYLNGKEVHAGAPVSDLLEANVFTYADLTTLVQPWHMSDVVQVKVRSDDTRDTQWPNLFFVAMNASDTPLPISECLIYSLSVNCQSGIEFGSGHETAPFVTMQTTYDELVAAYGEPDEVASNHSNYKEIFYYAPFNCVSFSFKGNTLRQVNAYYSANVYGALEETVDFDIEAGAMEKDALILMSQYLDVTPYLDGQTLSETDTTGILSKFDNYFTSDGQKIEFGTQIKDLPSPYKEALEDLLMPLERNYYFRVGRNEPEEFWVINTEGQKDYMSDTLAIKGFITESNLYSNWGADNSSFHTFDIQGITQDDTIDDVLALLGSPRELVCSSGERFCFAWLHYETKDGDLLRVRVDPMLNQVVEVRVSAYFENEKAY